MSRETLSDLAGAGRLEGRRVRLREDVGSFLAAGTVGRVSDHHANKALVCYVREELHEGHPRRIQFVESPLYKLELVPE